MTVAMAQQACSLYCRICGHPWESLRGFPFQEAIAMKWWELENLVKGLGCIECKGVIPTYIRDMKPEDSQHVQDGLTIQWMQAVRKACWPGQQPYPEFPEAINYPLFLWIEPGIAGRFSALGTDVEELIESIDGGADNLRIHPEARESEFENYQYGLWHVIPETLASLQAETSSLKYMNAHLLGEVFAGKSDLIGGTLWVLVGTDVDGVLTIDEQTVSRIAVVEAAIKKYGVLTSAIYQQLDPKK